MVTDSVNAPVLRHASIGVSAPVVSECASAAPVTRVTVSEYRSVRQRYPSMRHANGIGVSASILETPRDKLPEYPKVESSRVKNQCVCYMQGYRPDLHPIDMLYP